MDTSDSKKMMDDMHRFRLEIENAQVQISELERVIAQKQGAIDYIKTVLERQRSSITVEGDSKPFMGKALWDIMRMIFNATPEKPWHRGELAEMAIANGYDMGKATAEQVMANISTLFARHKELFEYVGPGTYRLKKGVDKL